MPHDMAGIRQLEESLHRPAPAAPEQDEQPDPPRFVTELSDQPDLHEGAAAHFDCRLQPVGDPSMRVEWFFNGRPLETGSRMHFMDDFGFIVLDLDWTFPRDSGEYVCRATNKWGTATTKATLICKAKRDVQLESQLPQGMSGDKLRALEQGAKPEEPAAPPPDAEPPRFIKEIENVDIGEGETAFFEARVEPKTDPNLRVEWYRNGVLVQTGHRFRTTFDFGYASLQILGVYPEDGGEYTCRAVNRAGQATCKSALTCRAISSVIMMSQVPRGMKKADTLMQMEAALKQYTSDIHLTEEDIYDADRKQPPRFVTQIQDQLDLVEMNVTKFECQLAPVCDPDMKVEWFFNGRPLPHKNRFKPIYDFGYVAMNFGWVYPEDSGEYLCRATNLYGMDETRAVIKTQGKPGIVYESQLPAGMQSVKKIQELESQWNRAPEKPVDEQRAIEPPAFVLKPEPCAVKEGDWSRFCCRLTGHPRPRVMWLINGHTIVNGTRYKLTYDGMWRLDIPKTRQYDHGKIEVIARNAAGEAYTACELSVTPKQDDYRAMLKNSPKPWYDYELKSYQKDRQDGELERVFEEKVRPGVTVLHQGEHQKVVQHTDTDWQKKAKAKKGADYYNSYKQLEEEQLMKESKSRESGHQFAVPGEKIQHSSVAKGMAASYMQKLSEADQQPEVQTPPRRQCMPGPAESTVQGKEVHTNIQRQQQKEQRGDLEIRRNITAKETSEIEHKAQTQERVVQGKVEPSKPPFFTRKMQPCRVFDKDGAKFEVEFTGDPSPEIKWYREDFLIQSSQDFNIETTHRRSVLQIREVFSEDSGQFSCIASNRGGQAKCSANLVVEQRKQARGQAAPPNFVQTIDDRTVKAGKLARFDAKLAGSRPMDVYWLKDGRKVAADMKYKILEDQDMFTLLILEPTASDSATYECVSINKSGEARCQAQLVVETPAPKPKPKPQPQPKEQPKEQAVAPKILEPMKGLIVVEGQSAMFRCRFSGHPAPSAQWLKDDKPIKPSKYFKMEQDGEAFILRISECFPEDEGTYFCVATNSAGKSTMKAPLKVQAPKQEEAPTVTPMKDVTVEEGQPARFSAKVSGQPTPTISWLREDTLIPQSRDFKMTISGTTASLEIVETYEEDSGVITCRATNSAGTSSSSAKLMVQSADSDEETESE